MTTDSLEGKRTLNNREFSNSSLIQGSKKSALFFSSLILLWAGGLAYLLANQGNLQKGGNLLNPFMFVPVVGFVAGLIAVVFHLLYDAFSVVDHFKTIFNPKSLAWKLLVRGIIATTFYIGFFGCFIAWFFFMKTILGICGAILLTLFLFWIIYIQFRQIRKCAKMAILYGASELKLFEQYLKIGATVQGRLENKSSKLNNQLLHFTLRNLAEEYVKENKSTVQKTFILNESIFSDTHKNGYTNFEIPLSPGNAKPSRFDEKVADYWELEVKNDRDDYYARFILNVQ